MNKKEVRSSNPHCVMFCHEGSFFKFYDIDALIVNQLCGYKIISCGKRPKAGVPLSNTVLFERLEKENISYFVFKSDGGILRRFDAPINMYQQICNEIVAELDSKGMKVETYFSAPKLAKIVCEPPPWNDESINEKPVGRLNKLEFLASGFDPYSGEQVIGMSKETSAWLKMVADFLKLLN